MGKRWVQKNSYMNRYDESGRMAPGGKKMGTENSYMNRYDESGRMAPGGKKMGTKNSYMNRYDESGRMAPGGKKMGTKPFFTIPIYLASLFRSKCACAIANFRTSRSVRKRGIKARYLMLSATWQSTENSE